METLSTAPASASAIPAAPEDEREYRAARKRVRELRDFYEHAIGYFGVNLLLTVLNAATSPSHWWVQWVWFGWGIGLAWHGLSAYAYLAYFGKDWEEKKIRELMEQRRAQ